MDAPAVSNPSNVRRWQSDMTFDQKEWLVGKLETQALYGQRVYVLEEKGEWARVAVESQPAPESNLGYQGWMPKRQLSFDLRLEEYMGRPFAQVEAKNARLYDDRKVGSPFLRVSYATRLPVVESSGDAVEVATPDDGNKWIKASSVSVYESETAIPRPTGVAVVGSAEKFLGLEYLWAGTSGFGFDCSGFTHTVYKAHGITIPRDTVSREDLARPGYGAPVERYEDLRKGDLLYFARDEGEVQHVGIYVGNGRMIHAPEPGSAVKIEEIGGACYAREYAGAIRYL